MGQVRSSGPFQLTKRGATRTLVDGAWLFLVALLPSLHAVFRIGRWPGTLAYVLTATAVYFLAWPRLRQRLMVLSRTQAYVLLGGSLLLLALLLVVVYPRADAGAFGGGSDRDDALNVAGRALWQGHYPYYERTYLDNPLSPLPGGILLSLPFVLLGSSAYQNLFWLAVLALLLMRAEANAGAGVARWLSFLVVAPAVAYEVVTGSDLLANGIAVFFFSALLLRSGEGRRWLLWALLLGITLSWRAPFLLLLPLLLAFWWRRSGARAALVRAATVSAAFAAVTMPFLLYDPAAFAPVHTAGRLSRFGAGGAFAWLIPLSSLLLVLLLAWRLRATLPAFCTAATVVLAAPILLALIAAWVRTGAVDLGVVAYAAGYVPFGVWSLFATTSPSLPTLWQ